jgi:hypothetical protein
MLFQVEFGYLLESGEFRPVMRQAFSDLKTACEFAGRGVMESPRSDGLRAVVSSEDGRVLRRCWIDDRGLLQDAAFEA